MYKLHERHLPLHYAFDYLSNFRMVLKTDIVDESETVIFTCDTEYTPPWKGSDIKSWDRTGEDRQTKLGLLNTLNILKDHNIRGTFLFEGILAKNCPELVDMVLENGHEIGFHGWRHESYGGWWTTHTNEPPFTLTPKEVKVRIQDGVALIKELTGKAPTSFVAPFDHIRTSTFEALVENGFTRDASIYNHIYGIRDPFTLKLPSGRTIYEIPFSVGAPRTRLSITKFYPRLLDADSFLSGGTILITCHPWEFIDNKKNIAKLQAILNFYDHDKARFVPMCEA